MAVDPNWTPAEPLEFPPSGSQQMVVAAVGDVVHLVWVQAKTLYHARRIEGAWQEPVKIAGGEQPALAPGAGGKLYCAYANWFLGNRDIYFSTWANDKWDLPRVVSRTSGESSDPSICVATDGRVHLAWADTTPGFSTIYYAARDAGGWTYSPVPNGKGSRPSIAVNADGIYLAWQDRLASSASGAYDIMVTSKRSGEWSLPAMVSDTRDVNSMLPSIAASNDKCHVVWQEERGELYVVRHSDLWPNGWEAPFDVSAPAADARLGYALANQLGLFQFVWSEGEALRHRVRGGEPQGAWWAAEVACENCVGLDELTATLASSGELHVVYNRWLNGGEPRFFYLKRKALEWKKVFVPVVMK